MKMELRNKTMELRANGDLLVEGYVNETNSLSQILGKAKKFQEKIAPGAFARAIEKRQSDIDFLAEHDSKQVLASTRNGSLELREDDKGLFMSATITPTTWGKDYYELISSGLVQNMSFGFRSIKDSWELIKGMAIRTVEELELYEVSVVKQPAYLSSVISARGIDVQDVKVPEKISEYSVNKEGEDIMTKEMLMEKRVSKIGLQEIIRNGAEIRELQTTNDGSAIIPEQVEGNIILKVEETSPVFAKARKLNTMAGEVKVARENDHDEASFVGEGAEILEGKLDFDFVKLGQKRVGAALSLSTQLINDVSVDIEDYATNILARRTAKAIEKSMLVGNGEDEFRGIIFDKDVKEITFEGEIEDMDKLQDLYLAIHPVFLTNASFIMNRDFFNKIAKLKDGNGHYYIQNGIVNGKLTYTLFGMDVEVTESLPTETPVVFGNIEEAVTVMIKRGSKLQKIVADTTNALRGSVLYVYDMYLDSAVVNPQAIVKLTTQL